MAAIPVMLFWALALWGLFSRRPVLLYLFFATMPVGAFAVIPPALTGGLTFTATPVVSLLLFGRTFFDRKGPAAFLTLAVLPERLMLLTLFWLIALVCTLFLPRLFAGAVMIVPMRGIVSAPSPLQPSTQNISQFAYLSISVFSVFAFARMLQPAAMRQHALRAMCLGGFVTVATGLLDYASQFLPISPLLEPFRTASYALLTDIEVLGGKRVVGLMPEASAFGAQCLSFLSALYFYRRAMESSRQRDALVPAAMALLALCAWLSTSSGTLVGLAVFVLVTALEWIARIHSSERKDALYRQGLGGEMSVTVLALIATALVAILQPQVLDPLYELVQRMVLEKQSSSSFTERGMWRSTALASLQASHGFGVGLGSTRSSSSVVGVFSSTGVIGGTLFYAFVLQCMLRRARGAATESQLILSAFRFSYIPPFVVSLMVGDADFGAMAAFGFGIVTAVSIAERGSSRRTLSITRHLYPA
ncbi:hypothetical protein [Novosphingobium album (ex Hu et al. 2023)]|uniref:O-antigen ligase domain-containing protein n=1 Tax=Novosphingobium album (ex Hu et al. 2023) TaxID=2930093 RepID=A0ABT0B549_9SPHN|nr:hypothetical protein [Novosphingobium album (ex Hu et al. 2023)]MCJ2180015.1 hypothetical protein [Novosphingobium album (ex Hu et al. 2023)]